MQENSKAVVIKNLEPFPDMASHLGRCNVCGQDSEFFYTDPLNYRETLYCRQCLTTSRYRSIARGILKAIQESTGVEAASLSELSLKKGRKSLRVCDTQIPFYYEKTSYPIPDLLSLCKWIDVATTVYRPEKPAGIMLGPGVSNQNLERLTFPDNTFDIFITSDVMEHVRLDELAHWEIRRVLKPGGVYLFTVPHFRHLRETLIRVKPIDPEDPTKDLFLMEKEYHDDANSEDSRALSYRAYGTDLDEFLSELGFTVDYCNDEFAELGIMNTELFFCRLSK